MATIMTLKVTTVAIPSERAEFTLKADMSHINPWFVGKLAFDIEQTLNIHYPQIRVHASIEQE